MKRTEELSEMTNEFKALGNKVAEFTELETFPAPAKCSLVKLLSDEVTAVCPVTSQPDWYTIEVGYVPTTHCVESKSFKLLLHSYRNKGLFCESLSSDILSKVVEATKCLSAYCVVTQKPRGGVTIISRSEYKKA